MPPEPALADPREARRHLEAALHDTVRRQLRADRPTGLFLSGGLDSGAIASVASQVHPGLRAVTVTHPDLGDDEGDAARARARAMGLDLVTVPVRSADVPALIPRALAAMDQPSADAVNTWLACGAAHAHGLVVALSGLGGDELFGGYPSFVHVPRLRHAIAALHLAPPPLRRALARAAARRTPGGRLARTLDAAPGLAGAWAAWRGVFSPADVAAALGETRADAPRADPRDVTRLELDEYAGAQLLRDTDAVSMAHALEVRVPLLDDAVVDAALAIPAPTRLAAGKACLAAAAGIPVVAKRPFALPFAHWMRGPLRAMVREALCSDALPLARTLDAAWRHRVHDAFLAGRCHWSRAWTVAALRLWPGANGLRWD